MKKGTTYKHYDIQPVLWKFIFSITCLCFAVWFVFAAQKAGIIRVFDDCSNPYNRYEMDSPCFNMTFRCEVECSGWDLNYTGKVDGCACDCGTGMVSACSGFFYPYDNATEALT
jgi:hypothetical protein